MENELIRPLVMLSTGVHNSRIQCETNSDDREKMILDLWFINPEGIQLVIEQLLYCSVLLYYCIV